MYPPVEVHDVHKRYGRSVALDGMSFAVAAGQVTGFLGPNGAGKSTTMRVILGLDAPDTGAALVGGRPYRLLRHPMRHVGSLLDASALHPGRSGRNHLLWLAHSQGLTIRRVDQVLEQVGLATAGRRRAGGYSLGMRQRLGIAAALLGDPAVLLLDEPFNGLDPEGIVWIRGLLGELAGQGRAVLVSSHLMSELQDVATHVVIVGRGRVIADTGMAQLLATAAGGEIRLRSSALPRAAEVLERAGAVVTVLGPDVLTASGPAAEAVVSLLHAHGVPFAEVTTRRATLEEAYFDLTRDAVQFTAASDGNAR
jgi:ABC-2 type transport system ATP-binding protein